MTEIHDKARQDWISGGGELISLPAQEQSAMINALASVGEDVSATKPELHAAYHIISEAAQRDPLGRRKPRRGGRLCDRWTPDRLTRAIAGGFALSLAFCSGGERTRKTKLT